MSIITITSVEDWEKALTDAGDKFVLVDFYADWCGPCKMIAPRFLELATQKGDTMVFLKVNVDDAEDVAKICEISAMPTFQLWQSKAKVDTLVGANVDKLIALANRSQTSPSTSTML